MPDWVSITNNLRATLALLDEGDRRYVLGPLSEPVKRGFADCWP